MMNPLIPLLMYRMTLILYPVRDDMVQNLMRYFNVEEKYGEHVHVIENPADIKIPTSIKQAMNSPFAKHVGPKQP
jgi:hypothetical protein